MANWISNSKNLCIKAVLKSVLGLDFLREITKSASEEGQSDRHKSLRRFCNYQRTDPRMLDGWLYHDGSCLTQEASSQICTT